MTIPAMFSAVQETADFLMLDLDSLALRQLIGDDSSTEPESVKPINLTWFDGLTVSRPSEEI